MKKYLLVTAFLFLSIIVRAQSNCSSIKSSISSEEQLLSKYKEHERNYSSDIKEYCGQSNNRTYKDKCEYTKNMLSKVRFDISNSERRKSSLESKLRECEKKN